MWGGGGGVKLHCVWGRGWGGRGLSFTVCGGGVGSEGVKLHCVCVCVHLMVL